MNFIFITRICLSLYGLFVILFVFRLAALDAVNGHRKWSEVFDDLGVVLLFPIFMWTKAGWALLLKTLKMEDFNE